MLHCIGGVARDISSPIGMATLIPHIYLRRERRRIAAEAERASIDAERKRLGLPSLTDEDED